MLKKANGPDYDIINKQCEIIKQYFKTLDRMQSRVEKVEEKR